MKTTQKKAVNAYEALLRIGELRFNLLIARKIMLLRKELEPVYEFYVQEERKLLEAYHAENEKPGVAVFNSAEERDVFLSERQKIEDLEVEIHYDVPIHVAIDENDNVQIAPNELYEYVQSLDGFIVFE